MNLALSTVGNITRKYKKYGDSTANLPRNERPRKINERTSRWISRNVQINPFITRSGIKTDLAGAGINVSKDTISRALYRPGFDSRSPRKVHFLKFEFQTVQSGAITPSQSEPGSDANEKVLCFSHSSSSIGASHQIV